jgi:hypothetical protein
VGENTVETLAADYSFARPEPAAIKSAGYDAVLRYLSHTPEKNLTKPEAQALHAADLSIGLVWETVADRAVSDQATGNQDRTDAEAMAADLGYPKRCVLFYAVDRDVSAAVVAAYMQGVAAEATHPVGVYGSLRVCNGLRKAGHVQYLWQTEAWSGTAVSKHAHLYQRVKVTKKKLPDGCDENVLIRPLPLWAARGVTPVPEPGPSVPSTRVKPVPRFCVGVVLEHLRKRTAAVSDEDRPLLTQLDAVIQEVLKIGAD